VEWRWDRNLSETLASYELTVLRILSSVIEDWKTGLLGKAAALETHSLAPEQEYKGN
jgi:hypothetical protein